MTASLVAGRLAERPGMAGTVDTAEALVAGVVRLAPTTCFAAVA